MTSDLLNALFLGLIQGLTEFLPVSSTAHLVLVHELTGFTTGNDAVFDIVLQLATAAAAAIYFRTDIIEIVTSFFRQTPDAVEGRMLAGTIVIGTIPAVVAGFLFEHPIETFFRNSTHIAFALIGGSVLMYAAERLYKRRVEHRELSVGRGAAVGFFQALALIPGVSRSGATISGGLFQGLERSEAVRFSFLLSIPIMVGATAKKLIEVDATLFSTFAVPLAAGFVVSFLFGLASIRFLTSYLKTKTFSLFVWYRILLALVIFLFL